MSFHLPLTNVVRPHCSRRSLTRKSGERTGVRGTPTSERGQPPFPWGPVERLCHTWWPAWELMTCARQWSLPQVDMKVQPWRRKQWLGDLPQRITPLQFRIAHVAHFPTWRHFIFLNACNSITVGFSQEEPHRSFILRHFKGTGPVMVTSAVTHGVASLSRAPCWEVMHAMSVWHDTPQLMSCWGWEQASDFSQTRKMTQLIVHTTQSHSKDKGPFTWKTFYSGDREGE
jgi:hypothetical protein